MIVRMRTVMAKPRLKAKWTHITPAPWFGHYRTHAHNHIIRAGIRRPWTAVFDFVRPHQHSIAAGYLPRRVFQTYLSDSSTLQMR